jgi:predicted metal-dependent peptidase
MSEDTAPVMTDPEDDQGSFFDDVLHIVTLDKYHSITLRVLTLEEQRKLSRIIANSKSMTNLDAGSWLAEKMIVDWKEKLKNFVMETLMADYSWSRPNRRYIWQNIYLPSAVREGMGEIVVGVDTSGSIDNEMLSKFAAEIRAIAHECKPCALHVVYVDAAVARADTFRPAEGDEVEIRPAGGGGTDFAPLFEWVEQKGIKPVCGIYLTDLCGSFPDEQPGYPVLWVTDSRQVAPFGETVRVW